MGIDDHQSIRTEPARRREWHVLAQATVAVTIVKQAPVCSDWRGYFGDYDAMILTGLSQSGGFYMRFYTDASAGCTKRWHFTAREQHVSQVTYEY